jgi:hypothetical protein
MKISRDWATPLVIGVFSLMAVTGILMFFELDSGLNKTAHQWLSWLMVTGVVLHVSLSWTGFKRYFAKGTPARPILALSALVIAASFVRLGGDSGSPPPFLAMQAVLNAPLSAVAPLSGRSADALLAELRAAGFALRDSGQSLGPLVGRDREREGKALGILFKAGKP